MRVSLEQRPLYSIGAVSKRTGIKADTLRIWERRYGLAPTNKASNGRREYTQCDLEHLQIIAALIQHGSRIGDIASRDRKTLELILQGSEANSQAGSPAVNPKVLFVGEKLSNWLDAHPGVVSGISAFIARRSVESFLETGLDEIDSYDALVIECANIDHHMIEQLLSLKNATHARRVTVCHANPSGSWARELERQHISTLQMPLDAVALGMELNRAAVEKNQCLGDTNTGELALGKRRMYSESELQSLGTVNGEGLPKVPEHLSNLIQALNDLEDSTSNCSTTTWQDVAVNSCIYAYTNQARWLMEKALSAALESPVNSSQPAR